MSINDLFDGLEEALIDVNVNKIESIDFDNKVKLEDYNFHLNIRGHNASAGGREKIGDEEFRKTFIRKIGKAINILRTKGTQLAEKGYDNISVDKGFSVGQYYFRFKLHGFKKEEETVEE